MTTYNPSDVIRVLAPFDAVFPDTYVVEGVDESGSALIAGGRSFADEYLELVETGNGLPAETFPAHITQFAFQNRFQLGELVAFEMASVHNPSAAPELQQLAATLRVERKKLESAKFVDLRHAETIAGVGQLETYGLIAAGRAAEILSTTVTPEEAA